VYGDKYLPFLGTDKPAYRRPNGILGHTVYSKPIHTTLYFHARSQHHLVDKLAMFPTLGHKAKGN
jgi:hypothetical protein